MVFLTLILAAFFAMNMGGSGMSPAFAAGYGAGIITRKKAALLFGIFVLSGAYIAGDKVVNTISRGIVSQDFIDMKVSLIVLLSAAISLFIANILKVAVSTSSVTVFSLISVGLYFKQLYTPTLLRIFSFWLALPVIAYIFTYLSSKFILPLEKKPWINRHQGCLKIFVLIIGCYVAFSVGSNNVANAVGPLVGSRIVSSKSGVLIIAPFFGLGGLFFRKVLDTVGKEITGLGILGAAINGIVIGTLLLLSSAFGMPEPMVMLDATSIMGIGSANRGHKFIATHQVVRKIFTLWIISPLISLVVTYLLLMLIK
jgi:sulfate permease